jgi:DNA invertase Pin-like site-specific DNA recombinase
LHQQGLDTTTPAGKAMFQMLGVFAEFERSIIQDKAEAHQLKETLAEVLIENRLLKKSVLGDGEDGAFARAAADLGDGAFHGMD